MKFGKTIKIFLIGEVPKGRMSCELSNWSGKSSRLAKNGGFSASQTHLWLTKVWLVASRFVIKAANFLYPQTGCSS